MIQKLPGLVSVRFINETFFPDYKDPAIINTGECFHWAYIAYHLFSNLELCDIGAHAFVRSKVTKKYYDSERPNGVSDWRDLPATNFGKGCGCPMCQEGLRKYSSTETFRQTWKLMQEKHHVKWHEVHIKINQIIKEYYK